MVKTVIGVAASAVATGAAIITIAYTSSNRDARQHDINRAVCTAVVRLDAAITDSLHRSLTNIPKLQYYKMHPDELRQQRAEIEQTLKKFRPPPECGKGVTT